MESLLTFVRTLVEPFTFLSAESSAFCRHLDPLHSGAMGALGCSEKAETSCQTGFASKQFSVWSISISTILESSPGTGHDNKVRQNKMTPGP